MSRESAREREGHSTITNSSVSDLQRGTFLRVVHEISQFQRYSKHPQHPQCVLCVFVCVCLDSSCRELPTDPEEFVISGNLFISGTRGETKRGKYLK